ncbi:heavy-metal-associated domain-containing protein [bacterium]|nr:heavy-metal-associated domain-containing protein [bacterium]
MKFQNYLTGLLALALSLGLSACNKPAAQQSAGSTADTTHTTASAVTEQVSLQAIGMHCDNCVQSIQGTVAKLDGVESVNADFQSGVVNVSFNPQQINAQQISAEIESLGFKVPGVVGSPEAEAALAEHAAAQATDQGEAADRSAEDAGEADHSEPSADGESAG